MESAVPKKKRSSVPAHATSCKTSKVPGEDCVCFVCYNEGTLVMCDHRQCPKAYHPGCVESNLVFFKMKGDWLCDRHVCSNCSKQPCTYCVMCPSSFCPKCLSGMPMEVFLPLSEAAGLCKTCMRLVKMIELQCPIDGVAVNFEDSGTKEFLFKEYWLLLKRFHGYNFTNYAPSDAAPPLSGSPDSVKTDTMPSMGLERKGNNRPIWKVTAPLQITATEPSPTKETVSAPRNVRGLIKRHSTKNDSNSPAKKKIRVLKLLNNSSSDDGEMDKPLSSMICARKQKVNSACELLPVDKIVSAEIGAPPLFVEVFDDLAKPFPVSHSSSPFKGFLVTDDSSQALGVAASTSPPLLPRVLPFTDTLQPIISPPALKTDACKSLADRNLCKKASSSKISSENRTPNLKLANDDPVPAKKLPGSTKMALPASRPQSTLASTGKPLAAESLALLAAKASPSRSTVPCKPLIIEPHLLKMPASEPSQLYQDTSSDKPSNASSDCKGCSLKANKVLPSKRSHEESCGSVGATSSAFNDSETLAPINVQNVGLIYLRRSHLEELLSNQEFTLLVLGAFVRIRNSKLGNNYRLVQIAGTALQAKYYQAGERKTNIVLEVLNLNRRQRIRIDHVSNSMFTEEECQRLQQSVELGFINAPTMTALVEKAAALQEAKANKCLVEKLAKLASESQPKECGLVDKELRNILDEGRTIPASPHHSAKLHTRPRVHNGKLVEADQESASLELATTIAERGEMEAHEAEIATALTVKSGAGEERASAFFQEKRHSECWDSGMNEYLKREHQYNLTTEIQNKAPDGRIVSDEAQVVAQKQLDADQHSDVSVEMTTVDAGKKIHAAKISFTSAVKGGRQDEVASDLPQGILQTEPRGYGTNNHSIEKHDTVVICQTENNTKGDGRGKEYIPTVVAMNDSDKGPMDSVQWFYQDLKGMTFGPFSLQQLRKWNRTGAFPPDLKIWKEAAGRRSFVFLTDALNPHEMEVGVGMGTAKCAAEECCLDSRIQREDSYTESGSTCHTSVKEMLGDRRMSTSRIGWLCNSAYTEQRLDSSISLEGDWTSSREKGKPNLVTSPQSTQFNMKDASGKRSQNETASNWKDPVNNKQSDKALSASMKINTDSCWEFHILEKETLSEGEREGNYSLVHTLAKGTLSEEEREGKSSLAHTLANETSGEGDIEGKCIPPCTEGKSSSPYTEQMLETLVTLDDGWSSPLTGKLDVGTLWTTQLDTLEEKTPSVKILQGGKISNLEVLFVNKECETTMHPSEQGRATSAESGWTFQTLAQEASSDRKRDGKSTSIHTEQRHETLVALDDGWTSPETDTETLWVSQIDALNKDMEIIRRRDGMLNNLIDSVITRECTEDMNTLTQRGEMNAESGWQCHKTAEETSAYGNKISCNREESLEKLVTLDDGWSAPDKEDLEQGILWGSLNSPGNIDSMVTRCLDKMSSRKLEARRNERDDTSVRDGAQKDADCNLFERREGRSLCDDIHVEKDQRWTHSSQGHARARGVEDADWNGSSRGGDTRVSVKSGCQSDHSHSKSLQVQASNSSRIDAGEGIERKPGRSNTKESTMCQRKDKSRSDQRSFSSEQNASPKNSGIRIAKEFMRSHSREPHKQDRPRIDQRSFSKEQKVSPEYSGKEKQEEARRSHSRNDWKFILTEQEASPKNAGKRTEDNRRSHPRNEQRSISREQMASPERTGIRTKREVNRSHSRNDQRSISRERKAFLERAGIISKREFNRSHSRSDWRSIFREAKATLESAGERTEKLVRKSHSRRSISKEGKASPESAERREVRGSHSRDKRGSVSREQKVSLESAWKSAEEKVKRSHSRNDRRSVSREREASPESAGKREVRRSHSRNDQRFISTEQKDFSESARRRTEHEVRTSHSRNDRISFSMERKASSGNAGKRTENEVRISHSRRSNSRERKSSSKIAGRRIDEEVWKRHTRDNMRSPPRELRTSPSSSTHRSFSRSVDDSRERKDSSTYASPSARRSFSRNFHNDVKSGHSKEWRWERSRYADNAAKKLSGRERSSLCEGEIQLSRHLCCTNESTLHGPQSSDRGWTPPDSPLNFAPRCGSLDVAEVERLDDPRLLSSMLRFEAPSSPQELLLHPGSPELVLRENYSELPPSPLVPFSAAPDHMKLPSPPPLPTETSTLCHIDHYVA